MTYQVYFARPVGDLGPIKIGRTRDNPAKRLRCMNADSPVELEFAAIVPADFGDEAKLHRQFDSCHLRGSWYRPSADLLGLINMLNAGSELAPLLADESEGESHRHRVNKKVWANRSARENAA